MKRLSNLFSTLLLALLLFGLCSTTYAAGGASFSLKPVHFDPTMPETQTYFVFNAGKGQRFENEVQVTNTGDAAGTVRLYAVDAITGANSGAAYLTSDKPRTNVGAWITLDQQELTLAPGEARTVKFKVDVPADARSGQHLGALVAENGQLEQGTQSGALQVNVQHRMITAVQVNLSGEHIEKLAITRLEAAQQTGSQMLHIGLRNDGTEMVKPVGTVRITNAQGQEVEVLDLQLESILPENEISYPALLQKSVLPAGDYRAVVQMTYGKQGKATYETAFTVSDAQIAQIVEARKQELPMAAVADVPATAFPWTTYAFGALLVLIVVLLALNLVRGRARQQSS